ncbi:MAG: hypothetical protein FWE82_05525 [Defluviitaleaceae bacterium]|nr:hypothetical protein [Defluviitaleaceae bacterium]
MSNVSIINKEIERINNDIKKEEKSIEILKKVYDDMMANLSPQDYYAMSHTGGIKKIDDQLASEIAKHNTKINQLNNELIKLKSELQKAKIDEYWAINFELKNELINKKKTLNEQIIELKSKIEKVPGRMEMLAEKNDLEQNYSIAMSSIYKNKPKTKFLTFAILVGIISAFFTPYGSSLILSLVCIIARIKILKPFRMHKKNELKEFNKNNDLINAKYSQVNLEISEIDKNIAICQSRIEEIDAELTKPR